jgi:hypothetical protein
MNDAIIVLVPVDISAGRAGDKNQQTYLQNQQN